MTRKHCSRMRTAAVHSTGGLTRHPPDRDPHQDRDPSLHKIPRTEPPGQRPPDEDPKTKTPRQRSPFGQRPRRQKPPGQRPPEQRPPGQRSLEGNMRPKDRDPIKETWDQSARQEVTSYRDHHPQPMTRMTHASEIITLPQTSFAGGKNFKNTNSHFQIT